MAPKAATKKQQPARKMQSLETKSAVYFYGQRDPKFGCLSNFHPCRFEDENGQRFFSSEQYFMKKKQETFDPENEKVAIAILKAKSPPVVKKLGRQVQNYDDQVWNEKRYGFMVDALKLKFSSAEELKEVLLSTEQKNLYEASRSDAIWGIGVSVETIQDTFRENAKFRETGELSEETRANWFGSNLLGKALMETRSWLISTIGQTDEALQGLHLFALRAQCEAVVVADFQVSERIFGSALVKDASGMVAVLRVSRSRTLAVHAAVSRPYWKLALFAPESERPSQVMMDLIEAMEEMERSVPSPPPAYHRPAPPAAAKAKAKAKAPLSAPAAASASGTASWDFVLQQAAFVQTRLKALWAAKHRASQSTAVSNINSSSVDVPFSWVLSKLVRLIEEYPDGVTEAIVVTELMALLQRKVHANSSATDGGSRKVVRSVEDMTRVLSELEEKDDAISSQLVHYDGHKLSIQAGKGSDIKLEMHVPPSALSSVLGISELPTAIPVRQRGRRVVFTNAKLMERRDVGAAASASSAESSPSFSCYLLPTQFLALHLDASGNALDREFAKQSIGLARLDQFVAMQDPAILQQLVVKVKVLDIGAVRPSQTPLHIHRQVIFLGDAGDQSSPSALSSAASTQRLAQASHVMILWDEQVALSQLFQIGDELSVFQPYIHVCDAHDTEILRIFSEYSSQQRCMFYLEYGSATVFFVSPQKAGATTGGSGRSASEGSARDSELQKFIESEQPPLRYEEIKHEWLNFSLYGHVRSIRVSHGIPLMAAYFYSYYDPKTNGNYQDARTTLGPAPTLDRAIVSRFYLVVLLQIYNAVSKQTLIVEVTGENALKALRLRPGQTVLLDGLVAVDVRSPAIRKAREHGAHPTLTLQAAEATFAFQSAEYTANRPSSSQSGSSLLSSIVALCSDWESIFGKQSMFSENSRLTLVNSTPGLLKTSLGQEPKLLTSYVTTTSSSNTSDNRRPESFSQMGMVLSQVCITYVGWLIPEDENPTQSLYSSDESCRKGYSTMCAHKACLRRLELAPTPSSQTHETNGGGGGDATYVPWWKCSFCQEIFSGMEETSQTFCELVVCLDDGSITATNQPLYAICHSETVESLLGVPAQDFSQLSLQDKFRILQQTIGKDYQVLLSRCEQLRVAIAPEAQQFAPTNHRHSSSGAAAVASPSPRKRGKSASAMATKIDLRIDLVEPLDAFASSHQLLQVLARNSG